ncbi:hypothetical protein VTO42DRAFT_1783 [Malbranchea cinnamomea]
MPPKRKHRTDHDASDGEGSGREEPPSKKLAMLKPRVRNIAESTIKSKWTTLPDSAQDRVTELLRAVELPVINRHRDERKKIEAQTALAAVRKNLGKRLPRMPFPPGTKDTSFDYEFILHENRALESQVTMIANSIRLLKAEIKREKAELAKERAKLEELERNAKAAKQERKRQSKNMHPVLRTLQRLSELPGSGTSNFSFADVEPAGSTLCNMAADPELRPIVTQLRNHLESMQNNASQVAGIREAIVRARSSLSFLPSG